MRTPEGDQKNLAAKVAAGRKGARRSPWRGASLGTPGSRRTAWQEKEQGKQ